MKKQLFLLLFSLFLFNALHAQFTISGKLTGLNQDGKVFLMYGKAEDFHIDSTISNNSIFTFQGTVKSPVLAKLFVKIPNTATYKQKNEGVKAFYLENVPITLNGETLKSAFIQGGKAQEDYTALQSKLTEINSQRYAFYDQFDSATDKTKTRNEITPKWNKLQEQNDEINETFIKSYPDSYVSLDLLTDKSSHITPAVFAPLYNVLSQRMKNTEAGKKMAEKLALAYRLAVGKPAIDFTQNNTQGIPVSLSSLKGKFILIDFWASWCGPCRKENPNLKKAYAEFRDKNFDILSVSIDSDKAKWLEAIKQDDLPWIHVSDLLGSKNTVIKDYGIRTIPQNVLVDPNGLIVAKNLRGEELTKKLKEVLN